MAILQDVKKHFNISEWGDGFFDINNNGDVVVNLGDDKIVSLDEISSAAKKQDLGLPLIVQFPDILTSRVTKLKNAFSKAIDDTNFKGKYIPVYPIKVNQKSHVVSKLLHADDNVGLEAGSKAEFLAILSVSTPGESLLVCNGYKDAEYIKMALVATAIGHKVFIVIEKISEIDLIITLSSRMNIKPLLGVRARLSTIDCAKGQNYSGDRSKFGLSTYQILDVVDTLKEHNLIDSLQVLHFHMGTQLANIRNIYQGIQEGSRIYITLQELGVNISYVNVGGGLAVDYEGTKTRSLNSKNYNLYEYAYHIIHTLKECCDQNSINMPNVITEAGRSMTAHHAVLLCEIVDTETYFPRKKNIYKADNSHSSVNELIELLKVISSKSPVEAYHDTMYWQNQINHLFAMGIVSLHDKAIAESIVLDLVIEIKKKLQPKLQAHRAIYDSLNNKLANKLFGNFSIFRSIPDVWAIDQIFPIMPIKGLDSKPDTKFIVADITCDSDGTFNHYIDGQSVEKSITLPSNVSKNSVLGVFLIGAYQDILGDNHNLFGRTHEVMVSYDNELQITCVSKGDTVNEVLKEVKYDRLEILNSIEKQINKNILDENKKISYKDFITKCLDGYTYLYPALLPMES